MITESYCSFEISKLLKKKGFDIHCDRGWDISCYDVKQSRMFSHGFDSKENWISSPTHQMACAWLRDEYHTFIEISTSIDINGNYHFSYTILDKECKYVRRGYTDFDWNYEDAVEAAIKYCLESL